MSYYELVHKFRILKNRKILNKYKSSAEDKLLYQVKAFNETWNFALKNFLFYKNLREKYSLPNQIKHLSELNNFPLIEKEELIEYLIDMIFAQVFASMNRQLIIENICNLFSRLYISP